MVCFVLFQWGWYVHPLVYGDYPKIMKQRIEMRSKMEGFSESRLPKFTKEEQKYLQGKFFINLLIFNYKNVTNTFYLKYSFCLMLKWSKNYIKLNLR